jgi:hypothetical protein
MMGELTNWIDSILGILTVVFTFFIGLGTLIIAFFSYKVSRALVLPFLVVNQRNKNDEVCIDLVNSGNGPALVTRISYEKGGVKRIDTVATPEHIFVTGDVPGFDSIKKFCIQKVVLSRVGGSVIRGGSEPISIFKLKFFGNGAPWQTWLNKCRRVLDTTTITIEYTDAMGMKCRDLKHVVRFADIGVPQP